MALAKEVYQLEKSLMARKQKVLLNKNVSKIYHTKPEKNTKLFCRFIIESSVYIFCFLGVNFIAFKFKPKNIDKKRNNLKQKTI